MKKLILRFDELYPISVNDSYIPTSGRLKKGNKRRSAFLRRSPELIKFQDEFTRRLDYYKEDIEKFVKDCTDEYDYLGLRVSILVGMPRESFYYKQKSISDDLRPLDASNYTKVIEDVFSRYIKIDDKYNVDVRSVKYCDEEASHWGFYIIAEPVNYLKYDNNYIKEVYINDGTAS